MIWCHLSRVPRTTNIPLVSALVSPLRVPSVAMLGGAAGAAGLPARCLGAVVFSVVAEALLSQ